MRACLILMAVGAAIAVRRSVYNNGRDVGLIGDFMNVEQMSVADLLREGKQAMALAMGSVGPDTRARWAAVTAEIDSRLSMGDIDEGDLEGRVQAAVKEAVKGAQVAVADKNAALQELAKAIAESDRAYQQIKNNATSLQFVQEEFNKNHPALVGELGSDLSRGAMLLWAWWMGSASKLMREFPLFDESGLDSVEHCCEWSLNEDRKRLHRLLKGNGHV